MEEKLNAFIYWAIQNDAFIDERLQFKHNKDKGIYVLLNESVIIPEDLIKIPKQLVIGPDLAHDTFSAVHYEPQKSFSNNELTILLISKLKYGCTGSEQRFSSYFDLLPKRLSLPFFWRPEEKDLLKSTDTGIKLESNFIRILEEWHGLMQHLFQYHPDLVEAGKVESEMGLYLKYCGGECNDKDLYVFLMDETKSWMSFRNYLWSYCVLMSRGFPYILVSNMPSESALKKAVLLPVIDLLNHKNNTKVKWSRTIETGDGKTYFRLEEVVAKGQELFNNYGNKGNSDLLLNYGFVVSNNEYDQTTLTLKLDDEEKIREAISFGIRLGENDKNEVQLQDLKKGINFTLSSKDILPLSLINFFAIIVRLSFEQEYGITLRMKLEALAALRPILENKIDMFKQKVQISREVNPEVAKVIKTYKAGQRLLFQKSLESLESYEKYLLKENKSHLTSFKTILKNDKEFLTSISKNLGIKSYEDIVCGNVLTDIVLLWLVRVSNRKEDPSNKFLNSKEFKDTANLICVQFVSVQHSIEILEEDIMELKSLYSSFFPLLSRNSPDIYGKGDWSIQQFVIANTVVDRIIYHRKKNQETFIIAPFTLGP